MEGCRASFPQSLIRYLLGGDGCLPVLVARGTSMKPSAQGGGAGGRYGLFGEEEQTQREIAHRLSISRSYVSRIEKNAIEKLRILFENK